MKDFNYNLTIEEGSQLTIPTTEKLEGFLEHIRIFSNDLIEIRVFIPMWDIPLNEINEENSHLLFKSSQLIGHDLSLVRETINTSVGDELYTYSQSRVALNDKLIIEIKGKTNTNVKIQFRISSEPEVNNNA